MQRWDLTLDETISSSKQEKRFECQSKGDSQQWTLGQRMAEREVPLPSVEPEDYFGFFSQPWNGAEILDDPDLQLLLFMSFILKIKWVISNTWFSRLLCFVYFLISIPWVYSSLCWISSNWLDVLLLLRPPPPHMTSPAWTEYLSHLLTGGGWIDYRGKNHSRRNKSKKRSWGHWGLLFWCNWQFVRERNC